LKAVPAAHIHPQPRRGGFIRHAHTAMKHANVTAVKQSVARKLVSE